MSAEAGLGTTAVRGASVTLVGQLARLVLLLVSTIVLARILSPRDFGLLAVVGSIVAAGELVRDFGLSTAAAREKHLTQGQKSNLFWVNTGLGLMFAAVAFATAPLVAAVFAQPALEGIVRAVSPVFILSGAATQFRAEINRELRFAALTLVDTVPVAIGLAAALLWAMVEPSYWVLVVQLVATSASGILLAVVCARWWPGLPKRAASIRAMAAYGAGLLGTQGVAYVTRNADNVALGLVWGPAPLGIYSRAYQLLMMPLNQLAAPLTRVAVPVLTRIADDSERFLRFVRSGQLVGGVGLGLVYALAIGLADPLVRIVFGGAWLGMIPVFQALAVGGVFRALSQVVFWIFLAKGRTAAQFRFYLVSQPLIVVLMLGGLPWGALGVAIGHSVGYALNWVIALWWCRRVTDTRTAPLLRSGLAGVAVFVIPTVALGGAAVLLVANPWGALGVGVAATLVYLAAAFGVSGYVRGVAREVLGVWRVARRRGVVASSGAAAGAVPPSDAAAASAAAAAASSGDVAAAAAPSASVKP